MAWTAKVGGIKKTWENVLYVTSSRFPALCSNSPFSQHFTPFFSTPEPFSAGLCSHAAIGNGKSSGFGVDPTWGDVGEDGKSSSLPPAAARDVQRPPKMPWFLQFPNSGVAFFNLIKNDAHSLTPFPPGDI